MEIMPLGKRRLETWYKSPSDAFCRFGMLVRFLFDRYCFTHPPSMQAPSNSPAPSFPLKPWGLGSTWQCELDTVWAAAMRFICCSFAFARCQFRCLSHLIWMLAKVFRQWDTEEHAEHLYSVLHLALISAMISSEELDENTREEGVWAAVIPVHQPLKKWIIKGWCLIFVDWRFQIQF